MAYIDDIFRRYQDNTCTEEELASILRFFEQEENSTVLQDLVQRELLKDESPELLSPNLQRIVSRNRSVIYEISEDSVYKIPSRRTALLKGVSIAASLLLVAGISTWLYYSSSTTPIEKQHLADIAPGTNRATLTLSDGHSVTLSEGQTELITGENGVSYGDGTPILENNLVQMASLVTPRAGQYQVRLPDGSRVWLNAASTLQYPTSFSGGTRRVELKGEAYFEVAKQKTPFIVATAGQEITVLGTHFNVTAYPDEMTTKTTLVEGKVRVSTPSGDIKELSPGRQANLDRNGLHVQQVNTEDYTAWREGIIVLERQQLSQVLRQIERWYDVEFDIDPNVQLPSATLSGDVYRDLPLAALLQTLSQQTGLRFERKERRVMVKGS